MLEILRDKTAPATARASAGRSLVMLEAAAGDRPEAAPAERASIAELDRQIAELEGRKVVGEAGRQAE